MRHDVTDGQVKTDYPEDLVMTAKDFKSDADWREQLTEEQYRITRQGMTERAFTGAYWKTKTLGIYHCVCCEMPLFSSAAKYDSGTGWPSFFQPLNSHVIAYVQDTSQGAMRTEARCGRCAAHLGHVFDDGQAPSGHRFCLNSASMVLREQSDDPGVAQPALGE